MWAEWRWCGSNVNNRQRWRWIWFISDSKSHEKTKTNTLESAGSQWNTYNLKCNFKRGFRSSLTQMILIGSVLFMGFVAKKSRNQKLQNKPAVVSVETSHCAAGGRRCSVELCFPVLVFPLHYNITSTLSLYQTCHLCDDHLETQTPTAEDIIWLGEQILT